jgi:hypothetical protein
MRTARRSSWGWEVRIVPSIFPAPCPAPLIRARIILRKPKKPVEWPSRGCAIGTVPASELTSGHFVVPLLGVVARQEADELLLELRIYLVGDDYNVGKQLIKADLVLILA